MKKNSPQRVPTKTIYDLFTSLNVIPMFDINDKSIRVTIKVPYICPVHKEIGTQYRTYDSIHNKGLSSACKYCNMEKEHESRRYNYLYVCECFTDKNATLISKEYRSNSGELIFICNNHLELGEQKTTFAYVLVNKEICKKCKYVGRVKENHYNWRGGITDNIRAIGNRTEEYKTWVRNVFKRDDFTCQCCKQRGNKLCAHHLYSFSEYKVARLNVNNGITLCTSCHDSRIKNSFHNIYGTRNTIPEDLYEYIQRYQSGEFEEE